MTGDMVNNMIDGYSLVWMLIPLLLWGGLVALIVWAVVRIFPARRSDEQANSAEEALRQRFARGEIDTEEYERSLEVLKGRRNTAGVGGMKGGGAKPKLLVAGLAAAVLLAVGAGVSFAQGQTGSMMGSQGMEEGQMMGSFNEEEPFDLQFIDQMIMRHQGAITSSEHMIADSERPELRQLAENIQESQSEQIEQMQAWREQWYPDAERTFGMMDPTQMNEMMGDGQMQEMMGGSMQDMMGGDMTDAMFLRMMIPHHQMAVDMSEEALDGKAEHPELEELAQTIRDEQSAEIELMQGYLEEIEETTDTGMGSMMGSGMGSMMGGGMMG